MAITTNHVASDTTLQNKPFRLLDLPAELWSKIGKLVIDNTEPFETAVPYLIDHEDFGAPLAPSTLQTAQQPPITRVCKALRAELFPWYYKTGLGCIWWDAGAFDYAFMSKWLRAIGPDNRHHLRGLKFTACQAREEAAGSIRRLAKVGWKIEDNLIMVGSEDEGSATTYMVRFG